MHSAQCPVCSVSGIVKSPFVRLGACSALVASGSPPPCDNMTDLTDFFSYFFAHNLSCYCTCHTCMLGMIHTDVSMSQFHVTYVTCMLNKVSLRCLSMSPFQLLAALVLCTRPARHPITWWMFIHTGD